MCSKTHQIAQLTRNMGSNYYFYMKNVAKYSPKRTKFHHFKKFSPGSMPPDPPNKRVAAPTFPKNILNPPPPPPEMKS